jgi:hypothetical protein
MATHSCPHHALTSFGVGRKGNVWKHQQVHPLSMLIRDRAAALDINIIIISVRGKVLCTFLSNTITSAIPDCWERLYIFPRFFASFYLSCVHCPLTAMLCYKRATFKGRPVAVKFVSKDVVSGPKVCVLRNTVPTVLALFAMLHTRRTCRISSGFFQHALPYSSYVGTFTPLT